MIHQQLQNKNVEIQETLPPEGVSKKEVKETYVKGFKKLLSVREKIFYHLLECLTDNTLATLKSINYNLYPKQKREVNTGKISQYVNELLSMGYIEKKFKCPHCSEPLKQVNAICEGCGAHVTPETREETMSTYGLRINEQILPEIIKCVAKNASYLITLLNDLIMLMDVDREDLQERLPNTLVIETRILENLIEKSIKECS